MSAMHSKPPSPEPEEGPALHPVAPTQRGPETPGLPLLRSWGAVYLVVAGVFVLWATLLYVFMRTFS
jgi:hypothetical protein